MKETKLPVFNEENQVSCLINEGAIVVAENTTLEVVSHNSCLDQRLSTTSSKEEEIGGESRLLVFGRASPAFKSTRPLLLRRQGSNQTLHFNINIGTDI